MEVTQASLCVQYWVHSNKYGWWHVLASIYHKVGNNHEEMPTCFLEAQMQMSHNQEDSLLQSECSV